MRRTARVVQADRVSVPSSREPAIQVLTDYPVQDEQAFYLRADSPMPELGGVITFGDDRAWYAAGGREIIARKVGYNFDPDAPLR